MRPGAALPGKQQATSPANTGINPGADPADEIHTSEAVELRARAGVDMPQPNPKPARPFPPPSPRILAAEGLRFDGLCLAELLENAGLAVDAVAMPWRGLPDPGPSAQAALLVLPLGAGGVGVPEIEALREGSALRAVPILGVARASEIEASRSRLTELGVLGVVDPSAPPEHVLFRVNAVVRPRSSRRSLERVPTCFAIELGVEGSQTCEYALNLSLGGIAITSLRPLEPNTDVSLRLRLPFAEGAPPEVRGRVVWAKPGVASGRRWQLGIFFYPLESPARAAIEAEIARVLHPVDPPAPAP